jgi:uncharacterized membrane protein
MIIEIMIIVFIMILIIALMVMLYVETVYTSNNIAKKRKFQRRNKAANVFKTNYNFKKNK